MTEVDIIRKVIGAVYRPNGSGARSRRGDDIDQRRGA